MLHKEAQAIDMINASFIRTENVSLATYTKAILTRPQQIVTRIRWALQPCMGACISQL